MEKKYSVGDPLNPKESDPRFETEGAACNYASEQTKTRDEVLAVWDDESGEVTHLVLGGWAYSA
ncbi:MAG: hypothetical protein WC718_19345 [Phycisphaerales bacterium]|jgi:hypothetical protein